MVVCCFVFLTSFVFGAYPLSTDDAGTVEKSKYELEFWYDNMKVSDEPVSHSLGLSFKHGITDKMDIGISFPFIIAPKSMRAFGVATLGLKFQVVKDILAFTISNDFGSNEYFINGIFSYQISSCKVHFNLGCLATGEEDVVGNLTYNFAVEYPFKKSDIVFESFFDKNGFQTYLFGLRYNFVEGFAFSVAYENGLKDTEKRITSGVHYEF